MIKYHSQSGLTLVEMLLAILLFSITIVGLINFHAVIVNTLEYAKNKDLAQRMAFELLDCYPSSVNLDLPTNWQYKIVTMQYSQQCKIVTIEIVANFDDVIKQQRWFCH